MPAEESKPETSEWRVTATWVTEEPNPNAADRSRVPLVRVSHVTVHPVANKGAGWDVYRELRQGHWVPGDAVEWEVDEPWRPW